MQQIPVTQVQTVPAPGGVDAQPGPAALFQALRAQRRELTQQLDELETLRQSLTMQLQRVSAGSIERKGLEARIVELDARIAAVDKSIASSQTELSRVAGIPGAVVDPPRIVRQGPNDEVLMMGVAFSAVILLPISIAVARRIWKRSAVAVWTIPRELTERLNRLDQSSEATALEVERIGEGQRFLTRLLTEKEVARVPEGGSERLLPGQPSGR